MDRPRSRLIRPPAIVLAAALLLPWTQAGCKGCKDPDTPPESEVTPSPHTLAGTFDTGALAPTSPGPWNIGVALFDELSFDPTTLEALDEPSLWEAFTTDTLPASFSVDLGASFTGWVLVILDDDGSGLPGTPQQGDLLAISPTLVTAPTTDLKLYLEETWDR